MIFLFFIAWVMALGDKLQFRFWDAKYALKRIRSGPNNPEFHSTTLFRDMYITYYLKRYFIFFPHVLLAFFWWNLYFLQLIPAVRRWSISFHRRLGRFLMVVAILEALTGVGMALTSHSPTVKILSNILNLCALYCTQKAWMFARRHDIARHKYWAMRLVGYLQTIALQRVSMFILVRTHQSGWYGLYPDLTGATDAAIRLVAGQMFDDSFVTSTTVAIVATEWYLAGTIGMSHPKKSFTAPTKKTIPLGKAE